MENGWEKLAHCVFACLVLLLLGTAKPVLAQQQNWNNVDLSYQRDSLSSQGNSQDFQGFGIGATMALTNNVLVLGDYRSLSSDKPQPLDYQEWLVGVGYRQTVSPNTDVYAAVRYDRLSADAGNNAAVNDGIAVGAGVRSSASPGLTLQAHVDYSMMELSNAWRAGIGVLLNLSQQFSIGIGYERLAASDTDETINTLNASVRYHF